MTTIELAPAILDHLNQEPEERKYWRTGYELRNGVPFINAVSVFDSEKAAWMDRERWAQNYIYQRITDAPYKLTRQQVNDFAISEGVRTILVHDEQFQLVEEWSVPSNER